MYKKQKAEKLLQIYNEATKEGLSGSDAEVQFFNSNRKFYFTEGGMEYSIKMNDVAGNLKDAGYDQVNEIKDWAQTEYE